MHYKCFYQIRCFIFQEGIRCLYCKKGLQFAVILPNYATQFNVLFLSQNKVCASICLYFCHSAFYLTYLCQCTCIFYFFLHSVQFQVIFQYTYSFCTLFLTCYKFQNSHFIFSHSLDLFLVCWAYTRSTIYILKHSWIKNTCTHVILKECDV